MYPLSEHLARRRLLYPSPLISAPSVLVIDLPAAHRGPRLPLGRYYPIIIETDAEETEVERFLAAPRQAPVVPDILDRRPSALWTDHVLVSRYDPPSEGWPWLSVCRWPDSLTSVGAAHGVEMARGCYTMEMFTDVEALEEHSLALIRSLGTQHEISVRLISADTLPAGGNA